MRGTVKSLVGIPEEAEDVLRFWFPERLRDDHATMVSQFEWWFRGGADSAIIERFQLLLEPAARGERDHWSHTPRSRLALIIVLDQFSRRLSRYGAGVRAGSEGACSGARGNRVRSLRRPRHAVAENVLLRGARASGNSGQARRGTGRTGAGRVTQGPRAFGGAGARPSRRRRALRAPSSSERSPRTAIHPGGTGLPGRRAARPHATAALRGRCSLAAVAGYSAAAA
jgi:Bacterial protein of unknown function (DUF924)